MGILYNRFTDSSAQTLIPYSNQSNILTYLVPSSFKGSSSTVWGDDYPNPMERDASVREAAWELNADNSVNLSTTLGFSVPVGNGTINVFTVYMVVRYNATTSPITNTPSFMMIHGQSDNIRVYEAVDDTVKARIPATNGTTYISTLTPSSPAFVNYHAYAFRHQNGNLCHVLDDGEVVAISTSPSGIYTSVYNFRFYDSHTGFEPAAIDVKFLSIVKGAESDTTIKNNVYNIWTTLNLS